MLRFIGNRKFIYKINNRYKKVAQNQNEYLIRKTMQNILDSQECPP